MIKMISTDDFKLISLEDKPIFDKHYEKYPPIHSDNVFTTLISWIEYSKYKYALVKNNIIIMSNIKNQIHLDLQVVKKVRFCLIKY